MQDELRERIMSREEETISMKFHKNKDSDDIWVHIQIHGMGGNVPVKDNQQLIASGMII